MPATFRRDGVSLSYPSDWLLEEEPADDGWSASFTSPGTGFLLLNYIPNDDDPASLVERALETMKAEYSSVEEDRFIGMIGGLPATGYDIDFAAFDLFNTCWIRAAAGPRGCIFVMAQVTDSELDEVGSELEEVIDSIGFDA